MATKIVEGFSISHAAILDGTTGAEDEDIYGVREGSLNVDEGSFDNTGDDAILSSWFWLNFANVTVRGGFIPFELIALLQGDTVTSSGTAPNDTYEVPLWTVEANNQAPKPMLIRVPAKDSLGVVRNLDIVLYRVHFAPVKFDGPSYKNGLVADFSGRAVFSTVNEAGVTLAKRAVGRLINRPV